MDDAAGRQNIIKRKQPHNNNSNKVVVLGCFEIGDFYFILFFWGRDF